MEHWSRTEPVPELSPQQSCRPMGKYALPSSNTKRKGFVGWRRQKAAIRLSSLNAVESTFAGRLLALCISEGEAVRPLADLRRCESCLPEVLLVEHIRDLLTLAGLSLFDFGPGRRAVVKAAYPYLLLRRRSEYDVDCDIGEWVFIRVLMLESDFKYLVGRYRPCVLSMGHFQISIVRVPRAQYGGRRKKKHQGQRCFCGHSLISGWRDWRRPLS